jgi:hypothetical protein
MCQVIHYAPRLRRSSDLLHHRGVELIDGPEELTAAEIRRFRLAQLVAEVDGGLKTIAGAAEVSFQNLDHILKRRKQGKARADGSKPLVAMGDTLARDIEAAMKLRRGWLDWPFPNVEFDTFASLGKTQRLIVQVKMAEAVKEQAHKKTAMRHVDKKAATDARIEESFGVRSQAEIRGAEARALRGRSTTTVDPKNPALRQRALVEEPIRRKK